MAQGIWDTPDSSLYPKIVQLYESGVSSRGVIEQLDLKCSQSTVLIILREQGVTVRQTGAHAKAGVCDGCGEEFERKTINNKVHLCLTCAPNWTWGRRYVTHGITKPQFESMLERQSGLCDLCELPLPENYSKIMIDHCHKQGHVRALLHYKCNSGLHYIEDDKFFAAAIKYVERHRK